MENLLNNFYKGFQNLDAENMVECYHPDIFFEDPAFGILEKERAKNMWRMLCDSQKGKDFKVTYSQILAEENEGSAHWEAFYTFSQTGRKVHNIISANFEFKDGLIIKHLDNFNLHSWAKQAMGVKGALIGKTAFFKKKLQQTTNSLLDKYENKMP
jgi:SnoaL-like domain